jgi:large subunit ribosomal protein L23
MATTKTKKNTEEKKEETANKKSHPLIKKARITEKSAIYAEKGIYTFDVPLSANKNEIKKAIKEVYGVSPLKVSMTQIADKTVIRKGRESIKQGGKKAVVHLKKGDKITFA